MAPLRASLVAVTLLALASLSANAQTARSHTVSRILLDGKDVASATGVTVTPREGNLRTLVQRGDPIGDGTRVDVPAHVVLFIASTDNKSTARLEPGASVTFVSTGKGERIRANAGTVFFDVVHDALDFYRVQYGDQIIAGVSGTAFSIEIAGKTVRFTCTRDAVSLVKSGFLQVGSTRAKVTLVDSISAAHHPRVTYQPTQNWTLGSFTTYAAAEAAYRRDFAAAKAAGDRNGEASALDNIGVVQEVRGSHAAALQSLRQALEMHRALGDRGGEASALNNLGAVQAGQRQYAGALQSFGQALQLESGDREAEAQSTMNVGIVQKNQTHYAAALQSDRQALAFYRVLGDRNGEASATMNIGVVQEHLYQHADALRSYQRALALCRALGNRDGEARTLANIGVMEEDRGLYAAALRSYGQALAIFRDLVAAANVPQMTNSIERVKGLLPK
jgi:hypothetical protein